jgi:hypothetical protein
LTRCVESTAAHLQRSSHNDVFYFGRIYTRSLNRMLDGMST